MMKSKSPFFFLLRLLLFLLPVMVLFFYLEINLRKVPTSQFVKRKLLEEQLASIEILNTGSSQALYAFAPRYLHKNFFNVADISQTIYYDRRITEKYLNKMPNLKLVIIPVSYFSLWTQLHDGIEQWREYYYLHYWGIDFPETKWYELKKYSVVFLYEPKHALGFIRTNFEEGYKPIIDEQGWIPRHEIGDSISVGVSSARERIKTHTSAIVNSRMPEVVSDLRLFIEHLKFKNIQVALVSTPLYKTYADLMNPAIVNKNDSIINQLCKDYQLTYFNHQLDTNFVITDFFDADHLNERGAKKYSSILKAEIVDRFINLTELKDK